MCPKVTCLNNNVIWPCELALLWNRWYIHMIKVWPFFFFLNKSNFGWIRHQQKLELMFTLKDYLQEKEIIVYHIKQFTTIFVHAHETFMDWRTRLLSLCLSQPKSVGAIELLNIEIQAGDDKKKVLIRATRRGEEQETMEEKSSFRMSRDERERHVFLYFRVEETTARYWRGCIILPSLFISKYTTTPRL